jgi:hypothetical protein
MRLQICGYEVAEQDFFKSCGHADAEVVASNCGIVARAHLLPNEN